MNYKNLYEQLTKIYTISEAKAITRMLLEEKYGLTLSDIYSNCIDNLLANRITELKHIIKRLANGEPIQYVLGKSTFLGEHFFVDKRVLIPRPETEELCQWIINDLNKPYCPFQQATTHFHILDIGTGSGCIAISLKNKLHHVDVTGWDLSAEALFVARHNAINIGVNVNLKLVDIFNPPHIRKYFNTIVSNPPYICNKERTSMNINVLDYEPHSALFVPDNDPLIYYRAIANYGIVSLVNGGTLYFETNPIYMYNIIDMLKDIGYTNIRTKLDQFGKERFIRSTLISS